MEFIYSYIKNICIFMLVITIITNIFPEKRYIKYIKFFAGILLSAYMLSLSLVVGNTFRLGCAGLPGCEGQHHQRDDVGHHVIHAAGDVQRLQEVEAGVNIGQGAEQAEQQGSQRDAGGLPLAEDHDGQCQEAKAGSKRHSDTPAVMNTMPPRPPSMPEIRTPAQRIL